MPLEPNTLETARFEIPVAHVIEPSSATAADEVREAIELGFELLVVRIDVGDLPSVMAFEDTGFRLMDTLVYYGRDVTDFTHSETSGVTIRNATPADVASVGAIARLAFQNYTGHYHADPRLDGSAADAAYVEWAETSVANVSSERPVLVCCDETDVFGFLTLRDVGLETAEIVLNAVNPDHQGRGLYSALVARAVATVRDAGSQRIIVSTQINNYAVQRAWARFGLVHERSLYTLHNWLS